MVLSPRDIIAIFQAIDQAGALRATNNNMNDIKIHNQLSNTPIDQTNRSKDIKLKESTEKMEAAFLNFVFKEMEKTSKR